MNIKMKKNKIFIIWYYTQGIEDYLEIWKNFLRFCLFHFSLKDLFLTWFSPWRRDIAFRDWRGWNPARAAEAFLNNIFSRFMGFIVRATVIAAGSFFLAATFALGAALLVFWLVGPLLLTISLIKAAAGDELNLILAPLLGIYFLAAYLFYRRSIIPACQKMSLAELKKYGVLKRVCDRMGLAGEKIDVASLENPESLEALLGEIGLNKDDFEKILEWETESAQKKIDAKKFWLWEKLAAKTPIGKSWKYAYTVKLDRHSLDLSRFDNTEYRDMELVGRKNEMEIMQLILERPVQNSVLLVGNPGVGKKTLIHHLAKLIRQNKIGGNLGQKRILLFELGEAISEAIADGENPDEYLRMIFNEAAYAGNVILVMENIEYYLGNAGDGPHPNIEAVIREYLAVPTFQIIATTTLNGYHNLISRREEIIKYFDVIEISETAEAETMEVMLQTYEKPEQERIVFTYQSLKSLMNFSKSYQWDTPFPERALDLMNEVLLYWQKEGAGQFITNEDVSRLITIKTGVPTGAIDKEEKEKLLQLENILHQRIIGQDEAVKEVAEALRKARSGMGNEKKPVGSFLFLGPTGVGKTETAKALAEAYFGSEERMTRLDMSEFQLADSIELLIGSGRTNQKGQLVKKAKDNPYSLLLLDEIEKAHPDILDLFLQILDEGFVTDAFGEKINFRNMIIIATSNAEGSLIKELVEKKEDARAIKQKVIDAAIKENIFRPEFMNRFNGIIFFSPLSENELASVVKLMLKKFSARLLAEKNIEVEFDGGTVEKIIKNGYDPVFGARSLNRYIENAIEDIVVKKIIAEEIKKGERIKIAL